MHKKYNKPTKSMFESCGLDDVGEWVRGRSIRPRVCVSLHDKLLNRGSNDVSRGPSEESRWQIDENLTC